MKPAACVWAVACACAGIAQVAAGELGGRYQALPAAAGMPVVPAEIVQLTPHRNAYEVRWEPVAGSRRQHGWGLLDGQQLMVAVSTGGAASGVAIYHHAPAEHAWSGPWISSLDGGGALGTIRFEAEAELDGRHALVCARPGAGTVTGTVEIKAAAGGYQLTFRLGRAVYYRGVGVLLPNGALAVGWSFGSVPAAAAFVCNADGSLTERRVSWTPLPAGADRSVQLTPFDGDEYALAASQGAGELVTPAEASAAAAAALLLGPATPQVKAWDYATLLRQYGSGGWAERWLERQLTPEERQLLKAALQRHPAGANDPDHRSIGTLIDEERAREGQR